MKEKKLGCKNYQANHINCLKCGKSFDQHTVKSIEDVMKYCRQKIRELESLIIFNRVDYQRIYGIEVPPSIQMLLDSYNGIIKFIKSRRKL